MPQNYHLTVSDELHRQVNFLRRRTLPEEHKDFFQQLNQYTDWLNPANVTPCYVSKALYFRDPIYGSVRLDRHLAEFILHPLVQRLNEVRQLGFAFASFPSATHTRLAHSIGVAYLAGQVMQRVLYEGILYSTEGKENIALSKENIENLIFKASLCGLIHDVSHCAYGHTVDRLLGGLIHSPDKEIKESAQPVDKRLFGLIVNQHLKPLIERYFKTEEIVRIVTGQTDSLGEDADPWDTFISMLINSDGDVDRLDYLQRDAFFTAEPSGGLNIPALIDAIRPWKGEDGRIYLTFSEDFLSVVEDFVLARDLMYLRCYDFSSKLVGEWLALRSMRLMLKIPGLKDRLDSFALLTDAQIPELLSSCPPELSQAGEILRIARCSGALAYHEIASVPLAKGAVQGELARVYELWLSNHPLLVDFVHQAEEAIANKVGCPSAQVLLTLPAPNATELRDTNIFLLRQENGNKYSIVPLTGQGMAERPGCAIEYPSTFLKPYRVLEEGVNEERRVTLSSFAVMERAQIRLFAVVSLIDEEKIKGLRQEFEKMCIKGVRRKSGVDE